MTDKENEVMFRHFDTLYWTVTSIFIAAIAVFANTQNAMSDLLALFITNCLFYFATSFRILARKQRDNKLEEFFPLQSSVYELMIVGLNLFFIYRLYLELNPDLYFIVPIVILLPYAVGFFGTIRGKFKTDNPN